VNRFKVRGKTVCGDLELSCRSFVDLLCERQGIAPCAPAQVPRQYQLGVTLNRHEAKGVSPLGIARDVALLLAADKSPNLVTLNVSRRDIVDCPFEKPLASFARQDQDIQDRVTVVPRDPLNTSHRATLNKQANDLADSLGGEIGSVQPFGSLTVGFQALAAAKTLVALSVLPKFLASGLAIMAGHWNLLLSGVAPGEDARKMRA
jgi:hypothetical protein